jgi:hypothetical protein
MTFSSTQCLPAPEGADMMKMFPRTTGCLAPPLSLNILNLFPEPFEFGFHVQDFFYDLGVANFGAQSIDFPLKFLG